MKNKSNKKNVQDATLKNIRALKRRVLRLELIVEAIRVNMKVMNDCHRPILEATNSKKKRGK